MFHLHTVPLHWVEPVYLRTRCSLLKENVVKLQKGDFRTAGATALSIGIANTVLALTVHIGPLAEALETLTFATICFVVAALKRD